LIILRSKYLFGNAIDSIKDRCSWRLLASHSAMRTHKWCIACWYWIGLECSWPHTGRGLCYTLLEM